MTATLDSVRFDYNTVRVSDLQVRTEPDAKGKQRVVSVIAGDEAITPSDRFWNSLCARYNYSSNIFDLFSHAEVFGRISDRRQDDRIRLCIERNGSESTLLAASAPNKPIVAYNDLMGLLDQFGNEGVTYNAGTISSIHVPRVAADAFKIGGDSFNNRFSLQVPIDGYGSPAIFLSLLRLACTNGAIAMTPAFKTTLSLGKGNDDVGFTLTRALDSFNSDEGYAALRERFEKAQKSWCSVYEALSLYDMLVRLHNRNQLRWNDELLGGGGDVANLIRRNQSIGWTGAEGEDVPNTPVLAAFHRMTGDLTRQYGLSNLDALSAKRRRSLPVNAKVYDIINFATEIATHYADEAGSRSMHAWVGELIANEYDMEGTVEHYQDFQDLWLDRSSQAKASGPVALQ